MIKRIYFYMKCWIYSIIYNLNPQRVENSNYKPGWTIVLDEQFDDFNINRKIWNTKPGYGFRYHPESIERKKEAPWVFFDDRNFLLNGFRLSIKNEEQNTKIFHVDYKGKEYGYYDIPYKSGWLETVPELDRLYGYFEIRAKTTYSSGMWPAFWLCGMTSWPPEIDIFEIYTSNQNGFNSFNSNIHWGTNEKHLQQCYTHPTPINYKDFHLYACEWDKDYIRIFFDNMLVREITDKKILKHFNQPMRLIINNSIDPRYKDELHKAKFPNYLEVDYVRIYEKEKNN